MPVPWGKSSAERVTLQSSQEEQCDGKTQAASEEIGGHSWAEDGMKPAFFLSGVSSNTCKENESLVLVPKQMTQVQKQDRCTSTISCNITKERTSLNQCALLALLVLQPFNLTN